MKIEYRKIVTDEASSILCRLPVRDEEREGIPPEFFVDDQTVLLRLGIDNRRIWNWPEGLNCRISLMPKDAGSYYLENADGEVLASLETEYVPDCLPGSFGDYFEADVQPDGVIRNWRPTAQQVQRDFWPEPET